MRGRYEIRLAGVGGQGIVLAGLILAEAAAIYDGKNAIQTQSYGAQTRGGPSMSGIVISDEEIDYPKVLHEDLLLAMSQDACDKYYPNMKKDGLLIADSFFVHRVPTERAYHLPITSVAREMTGHSVTASMVALGIIVGLTGIVSAEAIVSAVKDRSPRGTEGLNLRALEAGFQVARQIKAGKI
ncbi:MAG: 2-oxoacid:acceptor oxidoreductase family protein [Chloroflexi bacterium]|nr:2-oxoacid:acceptor oxidoreductase family protein [Chloroflexota bacterium]MCL5075016.1 2-oxoacid:acceptor oxidoreductase family protein [Chloroflexota bacterium]